MIIALLTFITSLLIYFYENITEIKTLVPMVTLDDQVEAESFEVEFTLLGYGGDCLSGSECDILLFITYSGFTFQSYELKCRKENTNCIVKVKYYKFSMLKDSNITLNCGHLRASSYGILVSMSSTSSIPDQLSSTFVPIFPDLESNLFRGQTPTFIKFELIPSVPTN